MDPRNPAKVVKDIVEAAAEKVTGALASDVLIRANHNSKIGGRGLAPTLLDRLIHGCRRGSRTRPHPEQINELDHAGRSEVNPW